jgi:hypothetical protein
MSAIMAPSVHFLCGRGGEKRDEKHPEKKETVEDGAIHPFPVLVASLLFPQLHVTPSTSPTESHRGLRHISPTTAKEHLPAEPRSLPPPPMAIAPSVRAVADLM